MLWIGSSAVLGGLLAYERIISQVEILRLRQDALNTVPEPTEIPRIVRKMRAEMAELKDEANAARQSAESYKDEFESLLAKLEEQKPTQQQQQQGRQQR